MTSCALFLAWVLSDPPLGDAARLPPIKSITEAYRFNVAYQRHLEDRLLWEDRPSARRWLRDAKDEAEWIRWQILDAAWGAHPEYDCSDEAKRVYHRRLRLALGREDYERLELGPVVPLWRFGELKR